MNYQRKTLIALLILFTNVIPIPIFGADKLIPVDISRVEVGGEIGRRIDITINNNVLVLDADKDFLLPFKQRNRRGGYIGLGKFIDCLVRFAAYSHDRKVLDLKKHIVAETIETQQADGYIGIFVPERRMWPVRDADRLPNGNILITGTTALIEITPDKEIVWRLRLKNVYFSDRREAPARGFYKSQRTAP